MRRDLGFFSNKHTTSVDRSHRKTPFRPVHRQNSNPNYIESPNAERSLHQDFSRFNNSSTRGRNQPRLAQSALRSPCNRVCDSALVLVADTYQSFRNAKENMKMSKENEFHGQSHAKVLRENEFHSPNFQRPLPATATRESEPYSPSNQTRPAKENEFQSYKQKSPHNFYDNNQSSKRRPPMRQKGRANSGGHAMPDGGTGDHATVNGKKKSAAAAAFDDEYIDDTLEDLERYRLKVDLEDFIVIDPESPDPILAMPLKPWTDDVGGFQAMGADARSDAGTML